MLISVRVTTGAKNERLKKISAARFELSVREKPTKGHANRRVRELIATHFRLGIAAVRITSGHHKPSKILSVGAT